MKLIIAGGRDFNDYPKAESWFLKFGVDHNGCNMQVFEIVSGGAKGADAIGEKLATEFNLPCTKFPARWDEHGKSARYKRNIEMANYADALLAFWDGKSKGTKHMIDTAKSKGLIVSVIKY